MSETYRFTSSGDLIRGSDGALIPINPANTDYAAYLRWAAIASNAAAPYVAPPPVYNCQLWQLQSVMTADQWSNVQTTVASFGDPAVSAFFAHGTNLIPSNSTTLQMLGVAIGLTTAQITSLVQQASTVSIS